jgi:hypothetical protein
MYIQGEKIEEVQMLTRRRSIMWSQRHWYWGGGGCLFLLALLFLLFVCRAGIFLR